MDRKVIELAVVGVNEVLIEKDGVIVEAETEDGRVFRIPVNGDFEYDLLDLNDAVGDDVILALVRYTYE